MPRDRFVLSVFCWAVLVLGACTDSSAPPRQISGPSQGSGPSSAEPAPAPAPNPVKSLNEDQVVAESAPPANRIEPIGASPGPLYQWISGHWQWHGGWEWQAGSWQLPPHAGATWTPGQWLRAHGKPGYIWQDGRWD